MRPSKTAAIFLLCVALALPAGTAGCGGDDDVLVRPSFSDPNLLAAVSRALNKRAEMITVLDLQHLSTLDASQFAISNVAGIEACSNLVELYLSENAIADAGPLAGLANLTWLSLDRNELTDLAPLAGLANLNSLLLGANRISDLAPLAGLSALTTLHLYENEVMDVSALAALTDLRHLVLHGNRVSDIGVLQGMTELTFLHLNNNRVSDILPLVNNAGLGTGDRVYLQGNPLSAASCGTHIPALEDRGVTVLSDCRP